MKFFFIFLWSFISCAAFGSAKVCLRNGTIEVSSELKFYGSKNKSGPACAEEIARMFNEPAGQITIGDKKFKVSYQLIYEKEAFGSASINMRPENNYIRIEDKAFNEEFGRSNNQINQNCGFYSVADDLGKSTTCTHEYAHGIGLIHYNNRPENINKPMHGTDLRGKGRPGIMAARGFYVDPAYQYNPKSKAGAANGTINPSTRKVLWQDVLDLKLDSLSYDEDGCAYLGRATNTTYDGDGSTLWQGWRAPMEAMKYILSDKVGKSPTMCESSK
jgi:hypothetical protein